MFTINWPCQMTMIGLRKTAVSNVSMSVILEFSDCKILIISIYLIIVKADILERYYKGIVFSQIVFFNFLDVYG